jgi:hypothetical protein
MLGFQRVHDSGTYALVTQQPNGWQIQINLHEPNHNARTITDLVQTLELAKSIADREVSECGHFCEGSCQDWCEIGKNAPQ